MPAYLSRLDSEAASARGRHEAGGKWQRRRQDQASSRQLRNHHDGRNGYRLEKERGCWRGLDFKCRERGRGERIPGYSVCVAVAGFGAPLILLARRPVPSSRASTESMSRHCIFF